MGELRRLADHKSNESAGASLLTPQEVAAQCGQKTRAPQVEALLPPKAESRENGQHPQHLIGWR